MDKPTLQRLLRLADILATGLQRTVDLQAGDECPLCGATEPPCLHKIAAAGIAAIIDEEG